MRTAPNRSGDQPRSRSGAGSAQRRPELGEHVLLALAHALRVEAHEAALLGGIGGALRALQDPRAERLGLLGRGLRADDLARARDLVDDLLPRQGAARLEVTDRIRALLGKRAD